MLIPRVYPFFPYSIVSLKISIEFYHAAHTALFSLDILSFSLNQTKPFVGMVVDYDVQYWSEIVAAFVGMVVRNEICTNICALIISTT